MHENNDPPPYSSVDNPVVDLRYGPHVNAVIEAANIRVQDEQEMQSLLRSVQLSNGIYNSDIEPEHESDLICRCSIHQYRNRKLDRLPVHEMWSKAVMYPGEKAYHDCWQHNFFNNNPYVRVVSPFGPTGAACYGLQTPLPQYYTRSLRQTIELNNSLNARAQATVDGREPPYNIWETDRRRSLTVNSTNEATVATPVGENRRGSIPGGTNDGHAIDTKSSRFTGWRKTFSVKPSETKLSARDAELRNAILEEETSRWPDSAWRRIVMRYQESLGITQNVSDLRNNRPLQYLRLLRAGYFEPIPVAWAKSTSNPLKFRIDAPAGWRGITPAWRGYENTAQERLYWVLNHRAESAGLIVKPDVISRMELARTRMASAVEPPPVYCSEDDVCHLQNRAATGYSKQVMPAPLRAFDPPQRPTDETMILLDVSGSMDQDPLRPNYDQFLITGYSKATQPKNKDVARSILRRFTSAMLNRDNDFQGYQMVTFSSRANYIGFINRQNFDDTWNCISFGGLTRVMTGWQRVKDLHFEKHSESASYHPVYGWQAGLQTPMLRLLLLLDGEAIDMDEFELDILSLSWVHLTVFLIGVDGCPHHHRHANELQRISDINPHVSFVDAQGNIPERFVTHELLQRHLGCDISIEEFQELEQQPPSYVE